MQHLDHDMDELFQKAAEDYPLSTGTGDWDAVSKKLNAQDAVVTKPVKSNSGKRKYLTAILLLLVILVISDIIIRTNEKGYLKVVNELTNTNTGKTINEDRLNNDLSNIESTLPVSKNIKGNKNQNSQKSFFDTFIATNSENEDVVFSVNKPGVLSNTRSNEQIQSKRILPIVYDEKNKVRLSVIDKELLPLSINTNSGFSERKDHGFYWGVLAGPQFSEVKNQGMTKTGFEIGIPIGYRLNKTFSIESGVFHATKYYFSDGKYFAMSKPDPSMPANMVMMDIEGKSNVLEIPLKVKVDVLNKNKSKVFATTGINSYLLTKENNNYHIMVNGTPEYMVKTYKTMSHYTAASLLFSAGYERKFFKQQTIRIEPYVQIPLKGIGVGAMPVTSAGLHIGITTSKAH